MILPKLDEIDALDRCALRVAWREVVPRSAPPRMSQVFMRRVLAFDIQAQLYGGLPKNFLRDLDKAANGKTASSKSPGLKPGSRLLREWNGVTYVVDVTEEGFVWNARTYRSLSKIAHMITGTHWSGPRFFGLSKGSPK
ncbi:Protein of unknown function [Shimia gijangensis]|uniref:DUF2924 domain-containing protein n=1 Tax=Shimia gijangensis TaxID=1470563 RepID=A0A1M6G398_9RHOB|nr:DUF2924 domain-containing protein [Shimia gijangensis]SHJ04436.1 Protein of unknown function [Shimia gijangensis]